MALLTCRSLMNSIYVLQSRSFLSLLPIAFVDSSNIFHCNNQIRLLSNVITYNKWPDFSNNRWGNNIYSILCETESFLSTATCSFSKYPFRVKRLSPVYRTHLCVSYGYHKHFTISNMFPLCWDLEIVCPKIQYYWHYFVKQFIFFKNKLRTHYIFNKSQWDLAWSPSRFCWIGILLITPRVSL